MGRRAPTGADGWLEVVIDALEQHAAGHVARDRQTEQVEGGGGDVGQARTTQAGVICFSPDGRRPATGGRDGGVTGLDVEQRRALVNHRCDAAVVAFHFDGGKLSVATAAGEVMAPEVRVVQIAEAR